MDAMPLRADIIALHEAGLAGVTTSFFDFTGELPYFINNVLPILEEAGLREPVVT